MHLFFCVDLIPGFFRSSGKLPQFLSVYRDGVSGDRIHELSIVCDQQHRSSPLLQKTSKPAKADDIEVVVRFVQQ